MAVSLAVRGILVACFALVAPIVAIVLTRRLFEFYERLQTYHYLDSTKTGGEKFSEKVYQVAKMNAGTSVLGLIITVLYINMSGSFLVNITLAATIPIILVIVIMNFTIRIVSFSEKGYPKSFDKQKDLKEWAHNFGFSFMLSLLFLLLFGFGLYLTVGEISRTEALTSGGDVLLGAISIFVYLGACSIFAIGGEILLRITGVHDGHKTMP